MLVSGWVNHYQLTTNFNLKQKMKRTFYSMMLAIFGGLISCHHGIAPESLPKTFISFGTGGGFTGAVGEFCLLENGQLLEKEEGGKSYKKIADIGKESAGTYFAKWNDLQLNKRLFQEPGDLYFYICMRSGGDDHKIIWGSKDKPITEEVGKYYDSLVALVPKK
jgi:hypothetical protein